jgi:hypothetical protein
VLSGNLLQAVLVMQAAQYRLGHYHFVSFDFMGIWSCYSTPTYATRNAGSILSGSDVGGVVEWNHEVQAFSTKTSK